MAIGLILFAAMQTAAVAAENDPGYRFLALGDSYTVGEGLQPLEAWPHQLRKTLAQLDVQLAPPRIIARTGWTTDELAGAIEAADLSGCFDLVALSAGVNNQYRGQPLDAYRQQFSRLLERAIDFAGGQPGRVLVLSIPDWSASPFARRLGRDRRLIARELNAFNAVMRELSDNAGVGYFDITPTTRSDDPQDYASDGLHPSARVYLKWVQAMAVDVANRLQGSCSD